MKAMKALVWIVFLGCCETRHYLIDTNTAEEEAGSEYQDYQDYSNSSDYQDHSNSSDYQDYQDYFNSSDYQDYGDYKTKRCTRRIGTKNIVKFLTQPKLNPLVGLDANNHPSHPQEL